jgi:hypothetical protein
MYLSSPIFDAPFQAPRRASRKMTTTMMTTTTMMMMMTTTTTKSTTITAIIELLAVLPPQQSIGAVANNLESHCDRRKMTTKTKTTTMMRMKKKLAHRDRLLRISSNTRCEDLANNWREPESICDRTFLLKMLGSAHTSPRCLFFADPPARHYFCRVHCETCVFFRHCTLRDSFSLSLPNLVALTTTRKKVTTTRRPTRHNRWLKW